MRDLAAGGAGGRDLTEAVQSLLQEKKHAEAEVTDCHESLRRLD